MSEELIWAPWRLPYVQGNKEQDLDGQPLEFLPGADIYPTIDRVVVNNDDKTVWVHMTASADPLFPAWLRPGPISAWGQAQARIGGE